MASHSLVIVESPAKARTIAGYLGKDYVVESSIGHIRDLPRNASDVPPALKKAPWARLGVDVEHGFKPLYVIDPAKRAQLQKLKGLLEGARELFLATDEDREGESIAWHLLEVLKPKIPVKRMVFHEITKPAIKKAIESPRDVDRRLVDAQEARRILDRLYGYEVSPVLWKKVMAGLSAGRVQSVATRIIVEREKQRMRFVKAPYWDLDATLAADGQTFGASLVAASGQRIATGKDFDESGKLTKSGILLLDEAKARALASGLRGREVTVASVERKPQRKSPAAPFMTSTLQQEASRKLRFAAQRTMRAAQKLYESGFITYMRTDSTQLSTAAVDSARSLIQKMYGADYLPKEPRQYAKKVKNAQEAHEAIRPAGDTFRHPDEVAREVGVDESKLYELIWMRTLASQMNDALGESVQVKLAGKTSSGQDVELSASGYSLIFPGFLRAYVEGSDDPAADLESRERHLPRLTEGQKLIVSEVEPKAHETQPPARFTEASLVQKLEELGVGRPSTYASIIGTIVDRGYVWKKGAALIPSFKAFSVVQLLEKHFEALVDYAFTAKMEDDLDAIAGGQQASVPWLERFYFGEEGPKKLEKPAKGKAAKGKETPPGPPAARASGGIQTLGLKSLVADRLEEIDARAINSFGLGRDAEDREITVRVGKWGPYLTRGESTASIPPDLAPDELTIERATQLLDAPSGDRLLGSDPKTGLPIYLKSGRFGAYVQLGEASDDGEKPKRASLLRTMTPETMSLEDALQVLSLPREVGKDPATKEPIFAQIGQYGGYVKRGDESRSMEREELAFTITLDEAVALLAQPKTRMRRAPAEPLKSFPEDPVSKKPIRVMTGRFGLYVTDGETNATLRRDDALETLTHERAIELLSQRREKDEADGGSKKPVRGARKAPAKSAAKKADGASPAKTAPGNGPAKKAPTKKAPAKKAPAKKAAEKKASRPAG
ncbi:MAG: type I DNA topoisomerase [Polyangiaceae bacterium]|nr:type I DNA topoisomerase [Polyangiaceae bacterium]